MITKIAELKKFRESARALCGSPSVPVCHLGFKWREPKIGNLMNYDGEDLVASLWGGAFTLLLGHQFPLMIPLRDGQSVVREAVLYMMDSWGVNQNPVRSSDDWRE
jgi:hypothetical protein